MKEQTFRLLFMNSEKVILLGTYPDYYPKLKKPEIVSIIHRSGKRERFLAPSVGYSICAN
jgi:hypothetical protein